MKCLEGKKKRLMGDSLLCWPPYKNIFHRKGRKFQGVKGGSYMETITLHTWFFNLPQGFALKEHIEGHAPWETEMRAC